MMKVESAEIHVRMKDNHGHTSEERYELDGEDYTFLVKVLNALGNMGFERAAQVVTKL